MKTIMKVTYIDKMLDYLFYSIITRKTRNILKKIVNREKLKRNIEQKKVIS